MPADAHRGESTCGPEPELVRRTLAALLQSEQFSNSLHLCEFLKYSVEQTLAGNEARVNEYAVATEALGRAPSYDSRTDTIVRVQAGRLRQRLTEFYAQHGDEVPLRIEMPRGSYTVRFSEVGARPESDTSRESGLSSPALGWKKKASLAGFGVVALLVWQLADGSSPGLSSPGFTVRPLTSLVGWERGPSWSPDGNLIAYAYAREGDLDIYVRSTSGGNAIQLTDMPYDERSAHFSPDGKLLAYVADPGAGTNVYLTPHLGGAQQLLAESGIPAIERLSESRMVLGSNPWSPDGKHLVYARESADGQVALWKIELATRQQSQITFPPEGLRDVGACWSFDGDRLVFERRGAGRIELWVVNAAGGEPWLLTADADRSSMPAWSADGRRVVHVSTQSGGSSLWDIDIESGARRRLTSGPWDWLPSVARDGRVAYNQFGHQQDLVLLDPVSGKQETLTDHTHENMFPRLSPDGATVAYQSNRTGNDEIWLLELANKAETRLTDGPARDLVPDWSPDGSEMVFLSERRGKTEVWRMDADGANQRPLGGPPTGVGHEWEAGAAAPRWSPDGDAVGYLVPERRGSTLWIVDPADGSAQSSLTEILYFDWYLDSKRLIYTRRADDTRLPELRAHHLETGEDILLLQEPAIELAASFDGKGIVYAHAESHFEMNLFRMPLDPPASPDGLPRVSGELAQITDSRGAWHVHGAGLTPSDDRIVYTRDSDRGDIFVIEDYK